MIGRLDEVVIDCHDASRLAEFWLGVLGGHVVRQSHEWVALHPPHGITVSFQVVPEPKTVKNRVHLDVRPADGDAEALRASVLDRGATQIGAGRQGPHAWVVFTDPEGNEFCI